MATVSIYLNFKNQTEAAFNYYKSVFNTEFYGEILRFGDIPPSPDAPPMTEELAKRIMHVELPLPGGISLMGTDAPEEMGFNIQQGNNIFINLMPDSRSETDRLYDALSKNGTVTMPLQEMFWGDYYGSCTDQFGIQWMFNCSKK